MNLLYIPEAQSIFSHFKSLNAFTLIVIIEHKCILWIFTKYLHIPLYENAEKGTAVLSGTFLLFANAVISHQGYLKQCFQNH